MRARGLLMGIFEPKLLAGKRSKDEILKLLYLKNIFE